MATKHEHVREYIRRKIADGDIREGDTLPGELELSQQLAVSRNTIRHALGALEQEFRLERTPGRGTVYLGPRTRTSGVQTIGVVNSTLMVGIYPEMIHGIEDGLYRGGYTMILTNGNHDHQKERESIDRMMNQGISGLVIEPTGNGRLTAEDPFVATLNKLDLPIITTGCQIPGLNASYVTMDDRAVGRHATTYLIERGHRRIGMVYMDDTQAGSLRFEGYREALRDAGIPENADHIASFASTDPDPTAAVSGTRSILDTPGGPPTAIFYFNDQIALESYPAFAEAGLSVPGDISVVGVDNIPKAADARPGLTTFNHPKYLMGKIVAEIMLARFERHTTPGDHGLVFQPDLVERESVARSAK